MKFAFLDIIFQVLICFVVLFVLDFIQPKSPKSIVETPDPRSEFIITITWPVDVNSDIDLWGYRVENPKSMTYFKSRENDVFILQNDNTSSNYGTVDGRRLDIAKETMTIERKAKGTYMISVHGYRVREDTEVLVEVFRVAPFKQMLSKKVVLGKAENQKEVPVFEFTLDAEGQVTSQSSDVFFLRKIGGLKR